MMIWFLEQFGWVAILFVIALAFAIVIGCTNANYPHVEDPE
jgi:hypothetical protein